MERLGIWRWPVVMSAINKFFIHEADNGLRTLRICNDMERLFVRGGHFVWKVRVLTAWPAVAMPERDRRRRRVKQRRKRLRCSRHQND